MAVPKKKVSKARRDKRRSNNSKLSMPGMTKCSNPACDAFVKNHCVCKVCGFYNGKKVLDIKADAKKALEATTAAIKDALVAGDKVALIGFGTFSVNERPAREGINPATKQKITIAAKKVAKFKAGADLDEALN